jgi:D-3-phosphoglycerate dehydrogenase
VKVLIADKFPAGHRRRLGKGGHECTFRPDLGADDLTVALGESEALVVRSTRVTESTLRAGERLELVIRAGAGTNTIDTESASALGISVCNVPGRNAVAVAELTLGLLIALDRRIADNVADLRAGRWDKKRYSEARGLMGARLGIVGLGSIGMAVAERAHAFGLRIGVLAKRRAPTIEARLEALGITCAPSIEMLAAESDILSFHLPAIPESKGLLGEKLLRHVRHGAIILNTSRGDLVDEAALLAAIEEKDLRVGFDVYRNEPASGRAEFESPLARHPNVYGTHHIGASTEQAQAAVADGVVEILDAFARGEVRNRVNAPAPRRAELGAP